MQALGCAALGAAALRRFKIIAIELERALYTKRPRVLAKLLAMLAEENVGADEAVEILRNLILHRFLGSAIGGRVILFVFAEAEAAENTQTIRIESEDAMAAAEQEDFLRAGIA